MKKTGVVLVCYHTPVETVSCMEMYAEMRCVHHIIIVVNDATEECRKVFEQVTNHKVEIIYQDNNLVYSKGNNIGIKHVLTKQNVWFD